MHWFLTERCEKKSPREGCVRIHPQPRSQVMRLPQLSCDSVTSWQLVEFYQRSYRLMDNILHHLMVEHVEACWTTLMQYTVRTVQIYVSLHEELLQRGIFSTSTDADFCPSTSMTSSLLAQICRLSLWSLNTDYFRRFSCRVNLLSEKHPVHLGLVDCGCSWLAVCCLLWLNDCKVFDGCSCWSGWCGGSGCGCWLMLLVGLLGCGGGCCCCCCCRRRRPHAVCSSLISNFAPQSSKHLITPTSAALSILV